jgi:hypothetical protein
MNRLATARERLTRKRNFFSVSPLFLSPAGKR